MSKAITIENIEHLDCVKNLDGIKKEFVLKRNHRIKLDNYLSIAKEKGFEKFCVTCSPNELDKNIIRELLNKI